MNWSGAYRKTLKMVEIEEVLDLIFYRPLAFLLVRAVYKTSITPNQISFTAIFMGVIAGCFYSFGQPVYFTIGALFYLLFNILDCSDGQLARLKKNGTPAGRIIDGISDYAASIAVYIGIIFGFVFKTSKPYYWLIMLILAGVSSIIHAILVDYYRNRFMFYVGDRKTDLENDVKEFKKEYESIKDQKDKKFDRFVLFIYLKYSALQQLVVARKKRTKLFLTTPQQYFQKNKNIMRFWVILGPTTQLTALVICSFFNRIDIFIWIVVAGFNGLAAILWPMQKIIDGTIKKGS